VSWLRPISSGRIRDRLKIVGDQLVFNFFLLQPRCFLAEARTKRSCGPDRIQLRSRLANIPGTDQPLTLTPPDSESPLAAESVPMPAAIAAALNRTRSGIPRSERRQLCATTDLSRIAGNLRALPPVHGVRSLPSAEVAIASILGDRRSITALFERPAVVTASARSW
jgi:hypothetical protein